MNTNEQRHHLAPSALKCPQCGRTLHYIQAADDKTWMLVCAGGYHQCSYSIRADDVVVQPSLFGGVA